MSGDSLRNRMELRETFVREMILDKEPCKICSMASGSPIHTCKEHMHYHARTLETSADACYKASLEMIFAHVADIHMIILKVLSDKYGHSINEMLGTIMESSEWNNIYLHPVLKSMVYFEQEKEKEKEKEPMLPTIRRKKKKGD